ncbi:MAG: hypothetical protein HOW73_34590 [Polyangiaceae bacterium]|nr:hypothetical protein [Polyangiaceae bacterium]
MAFKETELVPKLLSTVFDRASRDRTTPHAAAVALAKEKIRARRQG